MIRSSLSFLSGLVEAAFHQEAEKGRRWFAAAWLAGLFVAGVLLWVKFLNSGNIPLDYLDWAEVSGPRLAFLQNAVKTGQLPLHMPDTTALRGNTDRFLSVADVIVSPQVLLLGVLDIGQFVLANILLLYTIGAAGLLWLRRRFSLSLFAFSVLFLLFNFNGHILSHLSAGHANWGGYLLFPWLVVLTFRLLDGRQGWPWVLQTSLLLFFLFINGAFHPYAWAFIFLTLVGLASWKHFPLVLKALAGALLLSAVRILPIALESGKFGGEFITGYTTLTHLMWAMALPVAPWNAVNPGLPFSPVSWWEFDLYVGLVGVLFVAFFGIYRWVRGSLEGSLYRPLLLPLLAMVMLSIGHIYRLVMLVPIPLLSGERVSSRIISLPFTFLLVLGAIELQRWLNQSRPALPIRLAELGLLFLMVNDQWLYIKVWQVMNVYPNMVPVPVDLSQKVVANHPDPAYTTALLVGALISTLALLGLAGLAWRDSRRSARSANPTPLPTGRA